MRCRPAESRPRTSRRSSELKATWTAHSAPRAAGPGRAPSLNKPSEAASDDTDRAALSRSWPRAQMASWRADQGGVDLLELLRARRHVPGLQGHLRSRPPRPPAPWRPFPVPGRATVADQAGQAGHTLSEALESARAPVAAREPLSWPSGLALRLRASSSDRARRRQSSTSCGSAGPPRRRLRQDGDDPTHVDKG